MLPGSGTEGQDERIVIHMAEGEGIALSSGHALISMLASARKRHF